MLTVDKLLLKLTSNNTTPVESYMTPKDARLIRSLSTAATSAPFLTENQSKLLLKVLFHYEKDISKIEENAKSILTNQTWSKTFRVVEQVRKVFLRKIENDETAIILEYSFSTAIRKVLTTVSKHIQGGIQTVSTKSSWAELTEKNIVVLLDALRPFKFDVEDTLQDYYKTIKSWKVEQECPQLFFGDNLLPQIKESLDCELSSDSLILDRSLRYQFIVKKTGLPEKSLDNLIAYRTQSKIWVNSSEYTLTDLVKSLKTLNRLPALVVFDNWQTDNCFKNLSELHVALEANGINKDIGIYFRLPSEGTGKDFNTLIGNLQYNSKLDSSTQIAGVQTGKLPKFFLKDCSWTPKSVIVLGNNLRHSKTAVYSNRCDLVVSYSDKPSVFDKPTEWTTSTWVL